LATQVAVRHGPAGRAQSAAVSQQSGAPLEPKTHSLWSQAVAVWHPFDGVQSVGALQHGDAPAATNPQAPPLQAADSQALPVGHAAHEAPQLATLVSSLHVPLQS
jgi:hypothetical protein